MALLLSRALSPKLFALSGGFQKAVQDQPEKGASLHRQEHPSQMNPACGADAHPPAVARKPGEIVRGRADRPASRGALKTTDFEHKSVRIGKGVYVPTLNADAVGRPGDRVPAGPAEKIDLLVRRPFAGR